MAINSLPQNGWEQNRRLEILEDLTEYAVKITALVDVGLNCSLENLTPETMHNYLWERESLVCAAATVLEDLVP